jgi:hypothetical protein
MPYTVDASFDAFFTNINLPGDHRQIANTRRDWLMRALNPYFDIDDSFSTGSVPRYTALKQRADLDVFVVLNEYSDVARRKPSNVLLAVRKALSSYATTVRRDGQAVTLRFESWPNVDIVPAIGVKDALGNIQHYRIPDMHSEDWIDTRPVQHSRNVESRSSADGPNFRKVIKMIKHWSRRKCTTLRSYHLESMAVAHLSRCTGDVSWDVFQMFDQAAKNADQFYWYLGGYPGAYLGYQEKQNVAMTLSSARDSARNAWHCTYGTNSDHKQAIRHWRSVFGQQFPTYG